MLHTWPRDAMPFISTAARKAHSVSTGTHAMFTSEHCGANSSAPLVGGVLTCRPAVLSLPPSSGFLTMASPGWNLCVQLISGGMRHIEAPTRRQHQPFAVAFVDDHQQPDARPSYGALGHEIECPGFDAAPAVARAAAECGAARVESCVAEDSAAARSTPMHVLYSLLLTGLVVTAGSGLPQAGVPTVLERYGSARVQ